MPPSRLCVKASSFGSTPPRNAPPALRRLSPPSVHSSPSTPSEAAGPWRRLCDVVLPTQTPAASGIFLARDDLRQPVSLARHFVPWAQPRSTSAVPSAPARLCTDVKGHWLRGRRLFFGAASCSTCHTIRGEGSAFGPDLTNLIHRGRDSFLHEIQHPSARNSPASSRRLMRRNSSWPPRSVDALNTRAPAWLA